MSQTKKSLINLSHIEDLDGIGCQAILLRKFPNLICIRTFYKDFNEKIKKIVEMKPDKLFITDIGFNETYRKVYDILKNIDVCWIDHHLISESNEIELKKYVKEFIHSVDETVAAELTQKKFLPNDDVAEKIAKFAHYRDNSIENRESERLQSIVEFNLDNDENLQKMVEILSKGEFDSNWLKNQYDEYLKVEEKELALLEQRVKEFKLDNFKILFSFSSFFQTGKITRYLMKKFKVDIIFGLNPKFNVISIKSDKIDTSKIAKEFGGGGHFERAGFTYTNALDENDSFSEQFINDVLKAVKKIMKNPQ